MVGEALSQLLQRGQKQIQILGSERTISHLQFVDDIILFIRDEQSSIIGVKQILI